ncbi:septum formation initiator [Actinomadura vinacea]|uniref:Septum formation initiator n=1 Tax=Actinomadura vinacea TaxID=115336 RepID=A0ABN3JZF2_9ACTN
MTIAAMIATGDPSLTDDLLRLAAAADTDIELVHDAEQARQGWQWPTLILVGNDLAEAIAAEAPERRQGVVVVTGPEDAEQVYRRAVRLGAQDVARLPGDESWIIDAMAAASEPRGLGTLVCVLGATGGVGASVLSAALGVTAARSGLRTLLIDGDPYGGGIDLVVGIEEHQGARWPDFAARSGRLSATNLYEALPRLGDLSVLSAERGTLSTVTDDAAPALIDAGVRAFDLVIIDVPRYQGEVGRPGLRVADTTLVVVPAEVRATLAADSLVAALRDASSDMRVIVRAPAPGDVTPEVVARSLGLPLAGVLERDHRLPKAVETGDLVRALRGSSLADLCVDILTTLGIEPQQQEAQAA